jgi:hypothetical protein
MANIVSFSMAINGHGQKSQFQHALKVESIDWSLQISEEKDVHSSKSRCDLVTPGKTKVLLMQKAS